jgi:hypothetical protein
MQRPLPLHLLPLLLLPTAARRPRRSCLLSWCRACQRCATF